jgi:hypothetical protein
MATTPDELFLGNACQYYATARFAAHAGCVPVCGNLFHHAVEMFLKAGLTQQRALSDVTDMRHKLKKLWRAFKADFPATALQQHDKTISCLDKFEDIRYPDNVIKYGMGVSLEWSGPAGQVTTSGGMQTPRQYAIVVSDIDDLIADVFKVCSRNPVAFIGTHPAAREAITRHNAHSKFLTTWPPPP